MRHAALLAGLSVCLTAAPVLASPCGSEIEALSKRVAQEGRESIAASTSGKAEAAAREGQGAAAAPPGAAAQASAGSEKAREAKVALDEARTLDAKGDPQGCAEAVDRARKSLEAAP